MKGITIIVMLIFMAGCKNLELFPYPDLEEAIGNYVDNVGPIDNPYNEPTTTTIIFSKEKNDTLITVSTNFGGYAVPPEFPGQPLCEKKVIKGACYFHNRICVIVYKGIDHLSSSLVNESKLTLSREKYDSEYFYAQRKEIFDGFIVLPLSYREYILNRPQPLMLVEKSIGPTEIDPDANF